MDLLKYATKLSKMSGDEIIFRLRQQTRNRVETIRWKTNRANSGENFFTPIRIANWNLGHYPFPSREVQFFALGDDPEKLRNLYRSYFPKNRERMERKAARLLLHHFHFLGINVNLPDPIPWNQNPLTGEEYPKHHHALMDVYNTERYGDVKYVWELNRHQFFIELGKAFFITGDEKYADKIWQWLESWIKENPHKIGINHTSVLEHAVRIFSWIWTYFFTRGSAIWTKEHLEMFVKSLLLQGEMIEENLSYYYSPYNHLIGELAALALLGTVYDNSPRLRLWKDKYWLELESQVEKQFHSDGFTVEQASYYHHFTLGFYLMLAILRKQNNLPVSPMVWKTLERAIEISMYLVRPDGRIPMLGDIDSARSIYFEQPDFMWNLRSFPALGALLFKRGDMKFVAGELFEEILWLMGTAGVEAFQNLPSSQPQQTSRKFPESGYFIMRDGWEENSSYCCFDCGEIAHGVFKDQTPSAAHGHADILSFELCLEGRPLVIDPGFQTYFGAQDWHQYFRSTRGHNCIEVNHNGQAIHAGRISWSNVSSPRLENWLSTPEFDFVSGAIDGFAESSETVFHRRNILFRKGWYFLIIDEVAGGLSRQSTSIESSLHFSPGDLTIREHQLEHNGRPVALLLLAEQTKVSIEKGGKTPDQGWMAEGYGISEPAPVLRMKVNKMLPAYFGMLFPLTSMNNRNPKIFFRELEKNLLMYRIQYEDVEEYIFLNPTQQKFSFASVYPCETDALLSVNRVVNNRESEIHFIRVNHLVSKNYVLETDLCDEMLPMLKIRSDGVSQPVVEFWKDVS